MSRNTNRGTGTTDERALDEYADYAARAIADAVGGSAKKLAMQVGRSPRTGRRWTNAHRSTGPGRDRDS